jgi:hypothetical protein
LKAQSAACVAVLCTVLLLSATAGISVADAFAVPQQARQASSSALPDGRIYEQVSPAVKHGNYVASGGITATEGAGYAEAEGAGDGLVFLGSGAMGDANSSVLGPYVAHRGGGGWTTESAIPPQQGVQNVFGSPTSLIPSATLTRFAFGVFGHRTRYSPEQTPAQARSLNLYLSEDPFAPPQWIGKPTIEHPIPALGENNRNDYLFAGASADLSRVFFEYSGTLIPQDEARAANVGEGNGGKESAPWGFYEWSQGALSPAGVLPDGSVSPFGAVPAALAGEEHASEWQAMDYDNEVSVDGSRAFFVSPDPVASTVTDPAHCASEGPCSSETPQLYVREVAPDGAKSTVLVSRSQLPGSVGEPAPHGPVPVLGASIEEGGREADRADVYASADGGQAVFASEDRLTTAAPSNSSVKEYDFNVDTGTLTYLPGVVGPIVAAARDGSQFMFENTATSPRELAVWSAGPEGGHVTPVTELPPTVESPAEERRYAGFLGVEARASTNGNVFVFDTNSPIPGGFNNALDFGEVYRYEVSANALTCVSCPPSGRTPTGNATISYDNKSGTNDKPRSTIDTRVISSDGNRVFFDTTDALVPWDTNGKRDVYEWENGTVYLLSSGKSSEPSFYLDNSESGGDVFFNTADGLVKADADGAYDAYDARVPRPGDQQPPTPEACQLGDCQPPATALAPLPAPTSATLTGDGNLPPATGGSQPPPRPLTRAQKLHRALVACRHKPGHARHACEAHARKLYRPGRKR